MYYNVRFNLMCLATLLYSTSELDSQLFVFS